jgi:hypothetical protein
LTRGPSIFNNSAFGLRAKWNIAKTVYAMGAVLDGIPNDPARPKRTAIRFAKDDGSFSASARSAGCRKPKTTSSRVTPRPPSVLWGYSSKVNDQRDTRCRRQSRCSVSQRGGYVLGERTLVRLGGER